jgi:hypothetical protein
MLIEGDGTAEEIRKADEALWNSLTPEQREEEERWNEEQTKLWLDWAHETRSK